MLAIVELYINWTTSKSVEVISEAHAECGSLPETPLV